MPAKDDLLERLQYLNAATLLPQVIDVGIIPSEHNGVANLLRKGLGIVAFNILEDFIKGKTIESLNILSQSLLSFNNLSDSLQENAIIGALKALVFRAEMQKKDGTDSWKTLIQTEALKIHSTATPTYELSKFSLASSGSNVTNNDVKEILRAFGITGGWQKMKSVSDSIGGGIPDLSQAYNNASNRRHSAAHTASFTYAHPWISNIKNEILAICASFDILLTARCRQVMADLNSKMDIHDIDRALNYRFLENRNTIHAETITMGGRSRKNWIDYQVAIATIQPALLNRNEFLIILNSSRRIENWLL
jgi:hypothetical protein